MKVAIIGYGKMGREHHEAWCEAGVNVVAVADKNDDYLDAIDKADIVSIASPDGCHYEQLKQAVVRSKHVFCEKPLCLLENELDNIEELLAYNPSAKMACHLPLRHHPPFLEFKNKIPKLGRLYDISATYLWGRLWKMRGWRGSDKNYSAVLGGGIHVVDAVQDIIGRPLKIIAAHGNNIMLPEFKNHLFINALCRDGVTNVDICINFQFNGGHAHHLIFSGEYGSEELINRESPNKRLAILDFHKQICGNENTNILSAISSHRTCFAIERASHA